MNTVFDKATRDTLITRIKSLNEGSNAQWGKMTVYQMARHCRLWEEMIHSGQAQKQVFIGRIFGKMALKKVLGDEAPLRKNTPTLPSLKITGTGDLEVEKATWISYIGQYATYSAPEFMHPFFGKMIKEQVGQMVYKHTDHHLKQFGV